MTGNNPQELRNAFRLILQQALDGIADAFFLERSASEPLRGGSYALWLPRNSQPLNGSAGYHITITHDYQIVSNPVERGTFRIQTTGYVYLLLAPNTQGIIAYHWHPQSPGFVDPHFHLYAGARVGNAELRVAHLPTGHITLENFVRLLITQFHVPARRQDWEQMLADRQRRFEGE